MAEPATGPEDIIGDLEAEHRDLERLLIPLDDGQWDRATPAEGWSVRDQIGHLAYFDDVAVLAMNEAAAFSALVDAALAGGDPMEEHLRRGREMTGELVLEWWRTGRAHILTALRGLPPGARIPWFGPPMGVLSFVSARLMETWAHGQDVADALGVRRSPTARLRHVAHLGVSTRSFSYIVHGRDVPDGPVTVRLTGPSGEQWQWGPGDDAAEAVAGPALDFCLVVTQRRRVADTALVMTGSGAAEWMEIAQAFAGPPGPGR